MEADCSTYYEYTTCPSSSSCTITEVIHGTLATCTYCWTQISDTGVVARLHSVCPKEKNEEYPCPYCEY